MAMKVLVTGGSGFLGRHLLRLARERGYQVVAPRGAECDWLTMAGVRECLTREGPFDAVVHAAAYYGGIGINQAEPATIFYRNAQMALNVFEAAREYRIPKIVPIGSACAYPGHLHGDLKETDFWSGALHDSVEAYGFSKKLQQVAQRAYYKQYGIASNHLILTNLYGPHDVFSEYRSHVLAALVKKFADATDTVVLWGDGSPIREFLYVEDAAEAIVRAIALPHDPEPLNIGTGVGTSIRELAELIAQGTGFRGRIVWDTTKPNGVLRKVLDVAKMRERLQWAPRFTLRDGLAATIAWYTANKAEADARR
ncbi:MAG: NAD-dependent epimerase/dehydratase family protein [Deltaproteobacteria bacterium]|nr:NAD-dependent epimerase/dehydratase family protein [Deltaproteobacteria bacterium]